MKKIDLTGQTFGRLTVLEEAGRHQNGYVIWLCQCSCGEPAHVISSRLRNGTTRSCGCLLRDNDRCRSSCSIAEILGLYNEGFTYDVIAAKACVTRNVVAGVVNRHAPVKRIYTP